MPTKLELTNCDPEFISGQLTAHRLVMRLLIEIIGNVSEPGLLSRQVRAEMSKFEGETSLRWKGMQFELDALTGDGVTLKP